MSRKTKAKLTIESEHESIIMDIELESVEQTLISLAPTSPGEPLYPLDVGFTIKGKLWRETPPDMSDPLIFGASARP